MNAYKRPRQIAESDQTVGFGCGVEALDLWLTRNALATHKSGMSKVYVTTADDRVVGFYALASSVIEHKDAITRVNRGMPSFPIPAILITRLAVDREHQGNHLGAGLLKDAITRAINAADEIGVRAVHVHAKTDAARVFYERYGFEQSPTDDLHLQITIKTLKASYAEAVAPVNRRARRLSGGAVRDGGDVEHA